MNHWETAPLGSLLTTGKGISYGVVQPGQPTSDGVPMIRVSDIRNGRIATNEVLRIAPEVEAAYSRTRLEGDELLLTLVGTVGEAAVVPSALRGWNVARAVAVVPVCADIGAYWVKLAMQAPAVKEMIHGRLNTTVQATLNLRDVVQLPILVPPTNVREAIAKVIGAIDNKIDLNRKIGQSMEAVAQAVFNAWFVDFDPVLAKLCGEGNESICERLGLTAELLAQFPADLVESELGLIPKSWDIELMGDLCERVAMGPFGSDIKTDNFVPEGVPIIRGGNLKDGFSGGKFVYLTEEKATELSKANAYPGDIVLTHRGTLGQVGMIPEDSEYPRYVVSQSQMVVSVKPSRTTSRYIYEYLRSHKGQHALLANTSQVGVPAIARPTASVKALRLVHPPLKLLQAFDAVIAPMYAAAQEKARESNTLAEARDALLPRLLSGELKAIHGE
jgi:type I restriction enzyme, S subunit